MAFKKINTKKEIKENIENNIEFEKCDLEYKFIKQIIEVRKSSGLSQRELSKLTGLTQQMISRIETHNRMPTLKTLIKYIYCLGYKLELKKIRGE